MALNRRARFYDTHKYILYVKSEATEKKQKIERTYICLRLFIDIRLFIMSFPSLSLPPKKKVFEYTVYGNEYKFVPFRSWKVASSVSIAGSITSAKSNFLNVDYLTRAYAKDCHSPETTFSNLRATFSTLSQLLYFGCLCLYNFYTQLAATHCHCENFHFSNNLNI